MGGKDMLIRKSTREDAEEVGEVDVQAFLHSGWGKVQNMAADEKLQRERREEARQFCEEHPHWVYVAEEDDRIVGFATLEYYPERQAGRIENNGVLPGYQNRGISTQLTKCAVEELERLGAKYITVHTTYVPAARRVYEKVGFALARHEGESYHYEMHVNTQ